MKILKKISPNLEKEKAQNEVKVSVDDDYSKWEEQNLENPKEEVVTLSGEVDENLQNKGRKRIQGAKEQRISFLYFSGMLLLIIGLSFAFTMILRTYLHHINETKIVLTEKIGPNTPLARFNDGSIFVKVSRFYPKLMQHIQPSITICN